MTPETITKTDEETLPLLEQLEYYVDNWNTRDFADLVRAMDWSERPPEELVGTINRSLSLEMTRLARELTALGERLFPDNRQIQRLAYVLAPPTVRVVEGSKPTSSLSDSMRWYSEHGSQYRGKYVAVKDGKFLGAAETWDELAAQVQFDDLTLVTRVL